MSTFAGKVAVVTGGASGIGYAVARRLLDEGASVVLADVERPALARAAAELGASGVVTDVGDAAAMERLGAEVIRLHGRVDIAVLNAGVARVAPFEQLTRDDFEWVLGVNLWGVVHGMRTFVPLLEQTSTDGFLLSTASIAGVRTAPGLAAYGASKFAVVALTETLEQELAARSSSLAVGVMVPAMVRTNIVDSERNRPGAGAPAAPSTAGRDDVVTRPGVLDADVAAAMAVEGIRRRDLYVVTHPEQLASVRERHRRIEAAFERADDRGTSA
ncbi:SDR family NAD(P)-dependent oxidoreductase [Nocardioides panacihumi]|uniref:SDR family NAD(P)-dependent oxidoreductase n=1 Tax=Nocardioides panacihumi TaxID=400774 RepID=A0ABN2RJQ7_9ACTN